MICIKSIIMTFFETVRIPIASIFGEHPKSGMISTTSKIRNSSYLMGTMRTLGRVRPLISPKLSKLSLLSLKQRSEMIMSEGKKLTTQRYSEPVSVTRIASFPKRLALVCVSSTLGTPMFAITGCFQLFYLLLPREINTRYFRMGTGLVVGGLLVRFSRDTIIPFLTSHSEIIFPFAVCNGFAGKYDVNLAFS